MNAPFLPPIAQPPHDPLTRVLDARLGWGGLEVPGLSGGVEAAPEDGALALAPLAGSGRQLAEPAGSLGGLVLPRHAAWIAEGQFVLLDVSAPRLLVLDRCDCALRPWPCLAADDPRLPAGAVSVAAGCGLLLVCVPSQHRVIVLDASNGALRGVWPSPAGAPPWSPVHAVLLQDGLAAVADPARGGVHLCSRRGRSLRFIGGLGAVRALAVDGRRRLLVVRDGSAEVLRIELASGQLSGAFTRPADVAHDFPPLPVEVAADGAIDIAPLCDPADGPRWIGPDGQPLAAAPAPSANAYPLTGTWLSQALDSEIAGCVWDRITLTASLPAGTRLRLWSTASDALLTEPELAEPSRWQRAGEWLQPTSEPDLDCAAQDWMLHATRGRHGWIRIEFAGDTRATPRLHCASIDFARTPLSRYLPTVFAADPVAAEFGDRWLGIFDRALREVESQVDDQARLFDPLATPAAPEVPAAQDFLHFLAGWVGVVLPTAWPLDRQRHVLAQAPRLYPWRGTREGLTASLRLLLGLDRWDDHVPAQADCVRCVQQTAPRWRNPPLVLEHFTLRRWMAPGHARLSDAAKLWGERIVNRSRLQMDFPLEQGGGSGGAQLGVTQLLTHQDPHRDAFHVHAHRISVFVPAGCVAAPGRERALEQYVAAEVPAHVQAKLVVVRPRFRVGVQALLGLDAVIGVRTQPPVLGQSALGRATVLHGAGTTQPQPPRGAGRMRVGMSTITH